MRKALDGLDYRNLDGRPAFAGLNTTTEFLRAYPWPGWPRRCRALGKRAAAGVSLVKVLLRESPNAWAAYEKGIV